jgi:ribosomal-protein-alanine N-acetyltransferase
MLEYRLILRIDMTIAVRLMNRQDIKQVVKIDHEAFPDEWPPTNFNRELGNKLAHYIVAYETDNKNSQYVPGIPGRMKQVGFWQKLKNMFSGGETNRNNVTEDEPQIVGYAGMWSMADEAHITSIASRVDWRHKGIGEIMLIYLIEMAMAQKMRTVTLEVRVSNKIAQNLYSKFGFENVGIRKGYYLNNKEDAIIMTTEYIDSPSFKVKLEKLKQAYNHNREKMNQLSV